MRRQRERFYLKRVYLKTEAQLRALGSVALVLGALGLVCVVTVVVAWSIGTAQGVGKPPSELFRVLALPVAISLALLGAGLYPRLRPNHFVQVDAEAGTASFVERGTATIQVSVADIGPLEHVIETRRVRSGKSYRTATFHVARSRPFNELRFFESEKELKTRRALEGFAKAWKVPYVKPSGETRSPEELDVPLFQRLGGDEEAKQPLARQADSKLFVAWKDDGYEITTSYQPKLDRSRLAAAFAIPLIVLWWPLRTVLRGWIAEGFATPYPWLTAALVVLALLPGTVLAARSWLRSHRPPFIRVSAEGVRFRGRSLPLRSIEEIERPGDDAPRLVCDARFLQIDANFCEASEYDWLLHEIQRLVVEVGQRLPTT